MGRIILWGFVAVMAVACTTEKNMVKTAASGKEENQEDSLQYELITTDPQFETWYEINNLASLHRSQSFYESWNRRYVIAWDINSQDPYKAQFFEPIIGYNPGTDYGFELNHKLFYYFQYVERVLKIPILQGAGPQVFF